MESFKRAEACIYGYKNVITPKHVVVDRSLVLLLSFLRVYNFETISDYLHRCFRVVMGCAEDPDDFNKLFVHACINVPRQKNCYDCGVMLCMVGIPYTDFGGHNS